VADSGAEQSPFFGRADTHIYLNWLKPAGNRQSRMSIKAPKAQPAAQSAGAKKRPRSLADFIAELVGSYVIVAAKNGVIYEGTLVGKEHGFLVLRDVTVRGSKYVAKVDTLLLNPDIIQHIHGKPRELIEAGYLAEPRSSQSSQPPEKPKPSQDDEYRKKLREEIEELYRKLAELAKTLPPDQELEVVTS